MTVTSRSSDTRSKLLEAALKCFSEYGFDGTSIRMIAQKAGRPISLIGHHFGGKDGIYLELFRFLTSRSFIPVAEEAERLPRTRKEAVRVFREQIHLLYAEVCPDDPQYDELRKMGNRLFLWEMRNPKPEIQALLQKQFQPWVNRIKVCITLLRPDLTEDETILLGSTILNQVAGQRLLEGLHSAIWGNHGLQAFRSAELITEFNLQGLGVNLH